MNRDVILLSGGLDSTAALAHAHMTGSVRGAVGIDYAQRHRRELIHAHKIAARYGVPFVSLDMSTWGRALPGSSLTDRQVDVPHGHYAAESMRSTVVPNRNAVMLMAAAGIADAHGCNRVVTAVHAGDHPVYADCRPEFIDAARATIEAATDGRVTVHAPFLHETKADIARLAYDLGAPIGLTWSCYEGGEYHCGLCGTCTERREAFELAGREDPTTYANDLPGERASNGVTA